jgi:hypothetical protein
MKKNYLTIFSQLNGESKNDKHSQTCQKPLRISSPKGFDKQVDNSKDRLYLMALRHKNEPRNRPITTHIIRECEIPHFKKVFKKFLDDFIDASQRKCFSLEFDLIKRGGAR